MEEDAHLTRTTVPEAASRARATARPQFRSSVLLEAGPIEEIQPVVAHREHEGGGQQAPPPLPPKVSAVQGASSPTPPPLPPPRRAGPEAQQPEGKLPAAPPPPPIRRASILPVTAESAPEGSNAEVETAAKERRAAEAARTKEADARAKEATAKLDALAKAEADPKAEVDAKAEAPVNAAEEQARVVREAGETAVNVPVSTPSQGLKSTTTISRPAGALPPAMTPPPPRPPQASVPAAAPAPSPASVVAPKVAAAAPEPEPESKPEALTAERVSVAPATPVASMTASEVVAPVTATPPPPPIAPAAAPEPPPPSVPKAAAAALVATEATGVPATPAGTKVVQTPALESTVPVAKVEAAPTLVTPTPTPTLAPTAGAELSPLRQHEDEGSDNEPPPSDDEEDEKDEWNEKARVNADASAKAKAEAEKARLASEEAAKVARREAQEVQERGVLLEEGERRAAEAARIKAETEADAKAEADARAKKEATDKSDALAKEEATAKAEEEKKGEALNLEEPSHVKRHEPEAEKENQEGKERIRVERGQVPVQVPVQVPGPQIESMSQSPREPEREREQQPPLSKMSPVFDVAALTESISASLEPVLTKSIATTVSNSLSTSLAHSIYAEIEASMGGQLEDRMFSLLQDWTKAQRKEGQAHFELQASQRQQSEEALVGAVSATLLQWSEDVSNVARTAAGLQDLSSELGPSRSAIVESQQRLSKLLADMEAMHSKQITLLKEAQAEERTVTAKSQRVFEETLRTKYESLSAGLQKSIQAEHEARLARGLEDIQSCARLESERATQSLQSLHHGGALVDDSFIRMADELRAQWRKEEGERAAVAQLQARKHHEAILTHMENQLSIAMQHQQEADMRWSKEIEKRNAQQEHLLKDFETRCESLYSQRYQAYVQQTQLQLQATQAALEEATRAHAADRQALESRLRRTKLACLRWRTQYAHSSREQYQQVLKAMESKYEAQLQEALGELGTSKHSRAKVEEEVNAAEKQAFDAEKQTSEARGRSNTSFDTPVATKALQKSLLTSLTASGMTAEDKIAVLCQVLDVASPTPQLILKYQQVQRTLRRNEK